MRVIYLILICFAAPVAAAIAWLRGRRDPTRRERLADRFGRPQLGRTARAFWIHAASMGEVQASAPLIRRVLARYPSHAIVMTTMTTTGATRVKALFKEGVTHCYLPYDLPFAVRGFLERARPEFALILETELWPNLLHECKARGIRVLIASARISTRTAAHYRRLAGLFRECLQGVVIAAQTDADAERFKALGASNVRVAGNIKFDIEVADSVRATGKTLRASFGSRFVWVAGSTHASEEEIAIEAHRNLLTRVHNALLVIVPRHPQRFEEVRALLDRSGISYVTRSSGAVVADATSVLLVDAMGELLNFYAAADAAFVGGSLVPIGGHNLLEPAALAIPVLCGPQLANTREAADMLLRAGAARIVSSADELGRAILELASDFNLRKEMGSRAQRAIGESRGVLNRIMQLIEMQVS